MVTVPQPAQGSLINPNPLRMAAEEPGATPGVRKLLALYSYSGDEEGTINMKLGEEFDVIEEDVEGWSRVRRTGGQEEGFIPTSFTSPITDS